MKSGPDWLDKDVRAMYDNTFEKPLVTVCPYKTQKALLASPEHAHRASLGLDEIYDENFSVRDS